MMILKTEKGIKLLLISSLLSIISSISLFIINPFASPDVFFKYISGETSFNFYWKVISFIILIVSVIIGSIIYIIGLINITKGRHEFGIKHSKFVKMGIMLIILSIIISWFFVSINMAFITNSLVIIIIQSLSTIISSFLINMAIIFLFYNIMRAGPRYYLYIGVFFAIINSVLSSVKILLYEYITEENIIMMILQILVMSLSFSSMIYITYSYYNTYLDIKNKKIKPVRKIKYEPFGKLTFSGLKDAFISIFREFAQKHLVTQRSRKTQ